MADADPLGRRMPCEDWPVDLDEIDLADPGFWDRPLADRATAFELLRNDDPYRYFELPSEVTEQFPQRGFHALVRRSRYRSPRAAGSPRPRRRGELGHGNPAGGTAQ